ncbi:MAG: phosphatidate cytidylyltransferase [Clostridia bacterium]|nr:phosphatidate cytidylyltransferase [Clostridia bacterium]
MKKRAISSIFIMLAIVLAIASKFLVGEIFDIFVAVIGIVGAIEMCNMMDKKGIKVSRFLCSMFIIALYLAIILAINTNVKMFMAVLYLLDAFIIYSFIIFVYEAIVNKEDRFGQAITVTMNSMKVMAYPSLLLSIFFLINHIETFTAVAVEVPYLSFILIVFIWGIALLSDTFAYLIGSALRGPKLCPKISPNKSWSGAIGGVFGGVLMGVITYLLIKNVSCMSIILTSTHLNLAWLMILGGLGSAVSQVGDIFESWLKRKSGVKDSGNFMPGHGGMLDRVDALMFCLVFVGGILLFLI